MILTTIEFLNDNYCTEIETYGNDLFMAIGNGIISVSKNPYVLIPIVIDI